MIAELHTQFSPVQVGCLTFKNRICSSGHAEAMAEGGRRPSKDIRRFSP
jgi:2,4-dienoyl-CoA reductase-like NADH-dependent reductase (Old Yellow Enzyme family)